MFSNMENEKDLDSTVWSLAGLGAPRESFLQYPAIFDGGVHGVFMWECWRGVHWQLRTLSIVWYWYTSPRVSMTWMRHLKKYDSKQLNWKYNRYSTLYYSLHSLPPCLLPQEFHWLEFFAGFSACTRAIRRKGLMGARFDINFVKNTKGRKSNWMDLFNFIRAIATRWRWHFFGGSNVIISSTDHKKLTTQFVSTCFCFFAAPLFWSEFVGFSN